MSEIDCFDHLHLGNFLLNKHRKIPVYWPMKEGEVQRMSVNPTMLLLGGGGGEHNAAAFYIRRAVFDFLNNVLPEEDTENISKDFYGDDFNTEYFRERPNLSNWAMSEIKTVYKRLAKIKKNIVWNYDQGWAFNFFTDEEGLSHILGELIVVHYPELIPSYLQEKYGTIYKYNQSTLTFGVEEMSDTSKSRCGVIYFPSGGAVFAPTYTFAKAWLAREGT